MTTTVVLASLMLPRFRQLLAEQTTPAEVLNFIFVCVVVALAAAAVLYMLIMSALWLGGLLPGVRYARVFLPSRKQLIEYLGEYSLAIVTSLLLGLTFAAKHDLVEQIASEPLNESHAEELAKLAAGHLDVPKLIEVGATAGAVLSSYIELGKTTQVKVFVQALVGKLGADRLRRPPTRGHLLAVSMLMIVAYLAWLARHRYRDLRGNPDLEQAPDYARTIGGLVTLAVCIALLLASPTLEDNGLLTQSVMAAVPHRPLSARESVIAGKARTEIAKANEVEEANGKLEALRSSVRALNAEHRRFRDSAAALAAQLNELRLKIAEQADRGASDSLARLLAALNGRVRPLEAWHGSGAILVLVEPQGQYFISRMGVLGRPLQGSDAGFHRLGPGRYLVRAAVSAPPAIDTVDVSAGEVAVARIRIRNVISRGVDSVSPGLKSSIRSASRL